MLTNKLYKKRPDPKFTDPKFDTKFWVTALLLSFCSLFSQESVESYYTYCDCDYNIYLLLAQNRTATIKVTDAGKTTILRRTWRTTPEKKIEISYQGKTDVFEKKAFLENPLFPTVYGYVPGLKAVSLSSGSLFSSRPVMYAASSEQEYDIVPLVYRMNSRSVSHLPSKERTVFEFLFRGDCTSATKMLKENNDINASIKNDFNATLLMYASSQGCHETVGVLLSRKASVTDRDGVIGEYGGNTPLHLAVSYPQIVKMLLGAGSPRQSRNESGKTPLDLAKDLHLIETVKILETK